MDLTKVPLNEYGHVQTRDGWRARVLCADRTGNDSRPAIALITEAKGYERIQVYARDGRYNIDVQPSGFDLIPVPKKVRVKGWLNVYSPEHFVPHLRRETADANAKYDRIACIPIDIEVTEGEGLTPRS